MKRLLTLVIFSFWNSLYSQENTLDVKPAQNVTLIKREFVQNSINETIISNILPEDPIEETIDANELDGEIITYDPSNTSGSTGGGILDPSTIVLSTGITKGELSVSLTGSATYSIPIAVPPGIAGTNPQVNLVYNSQGGNGLAGYGWNISGVSAITRIGTTKFHDAIIDAVDFDALDRFAFDGQRLMLKSGTYGSNGAEYQTESYSNIKITSHGVSPYGANYGPAYFLVRYPDGSKAYYGQNVNSRSRTDWAITYWENPIGVRISYEYYLSNNLLSISKIKYGTKNSTPAINEIQFLYKTRQRAEQYYLGGVSFVNSNILSQIKVIGNGVGYRNYYLSHNITSLGYERLASITEKTGDNSKSLNPTVFSYKDTTYEIEQDGITTLLDLSQINNNDNSTITGDFNGDGSLDVIIYPKTGIDANKKYWLFTNLSNTGAYSTGAEHITGEYKKILPTAWLNEDNKFMQYQGWTVVRYNVYNGISFFDNYSISNNISSNSPIYLQYSKNYQFPKIPNNIAFE